MDDGPVTYPQVRWCARCVRVEICNMGSQFPVVCDHYVERLGSGL